MTVTPADPESANAISATLDRDTFVAYVSNSGTITLTYSTAWSADPSDYGITVTGTPANGDQITVVYVKANRGTLTAASPSSFNSTGWNLFDVSAGYAKVVYYSEEYGYKIGGSYTIVNFSPTLSGERTTVTVTDGYFSIPSNGYVFVTSGDATTYIYPTWSDWTEGYSGNFEGYSLDTISLSEAMLNFPNGLLSVGNIRDEINLNTQRAINRIQRLAYTSENLENVIASGLAYDTDTNYIFVELQNPVTSAITISGDYSVSDHGIEYFTGTTVPVVTECLYGENLKDKLRTDVLTISQQELSPSQQAQVRENINAANSTDFFIVKSFTCSFSSLQSGYTISNKKSDFNFAGISGYSPLTLMDFDTDQNGIALCGFNMDAGDNDNFVRIVNSSNATKSGTITVKVLFVRTAMITIPT